MTNITLDCKGLKFAAVWNALILVSIFQGVLSIKFISIEIAPHPVVGDTVDLRCSYDMEGDELYSVKWYKGGYEFYRYMPKDRPPAQKYSVLGTKVDLRTSDRHVVTLLEVDLMSSGIYRCEISAEAPSFSTVHAEKEMFVITLPAEGPKITGGSHRYHVGDTVRVNCTSSRSKPAAILKWTINGKNIIVDMSSVIVRHTKQIIRVVAGEAIPFVGKYLIYPKSVRSLVPPSTALDLGLETLCMFSGANRKWPQLLLSYLGVNPAALTVKNHLQEYPISEHTDGLETSVLGLEFEVNESHFHDGEMRLRCSASIAQVYHKSNEESVHGGNSNQQTSVLESRDTLSQVAPNWATPRSSKCHWLVIVLGEVIALLLR